jgi:hypothetical protein
MDARKFPTERTAVETPWKEIAQEIGLTMLNLRMGCESPILLCTEVNSSAI